ncbi:hypothetical protein ABZ299_04630 [Streptomyces sp. NPDC006184]|uniref:hypothetical protein n=1 Tax=Streptomyces sp. NPDC006184 TaxID=3155455 RepID=UPI0033BC10A3
MTAPRQTSRPVRRELRLARPAWHTAMAPDRLPWALGRLLDGATICWHADPPASFGPQMRGYRLVLADPEGGTLTAEREAADFSARERLAAQALVRVVRMRRALARPRPARPLALPRGERLLLHPATVAEQDAVATLLPREHQADRGRLNLLLSPRLGRGVLATTADGHAVGWAALIWDGPGAEIMLLVTGTWAKRRLGDALLRELTGIALSAGLRDMWVHTTCDDASVGDAVFRVFRHVDVDSDATGTTLTVLPDDALDEQTVMIPGTGISPRRWTAP